MDKLISKIEEKYFEIGENIHDLELQQERAKQIETKIKKAKENLIQTVIDSVKSTLDSEKATFKKLIDGLTAKTESLSKENETLNTQIQSLYKENIQNPHTGVIEDYFVIENLTKELESVKNNWQTLSKQMKDILAENQKLRDIAGVPEHYGINLSEIRMMKKQKIDEYKTRIEILENGTRELENERIKLKNKIKYFSELYEKIGIDFHSLNTEQIKLIIEFTDNLREGRKGFDLDEKSKNLIVEIQALKHQVQILEVNLDEKTAELDVKNSLLEKIVKEKSENNNLPNKLFQNHDEKTIIPSSWPLTPISALIQECKQETSFKPNPETPISLSGDLIHDTKLIQQQIKEILDQLPINTNEPALNTLLNKIKAIFHSQQEFYKQYYSLLYKCREEKNNSESNPDKSASKTHSGVNLNVSNLDSSITNKDLERIFEKYGKILSVKVIIDYNSKASKGYGFVLFADESAAEKAIDGVNGLEVCGRLVRVKRTKDFVSRRHAEEGLYEREKRSTERHRRSSERYEIEKGRSTERSKKSKERFDYEDRRKSRHRSRSRFR